MDHAREVYTSEDAMLTDEELAIASESKWSAEDWAHAFPKLQPDCIQVVPVRHPDWDDTWSIAVYYPSNLELGDNQERVGHKLRGILKRIKCQTYQDAQKVCSFLVVGQDHIKIKELTDEDRDALGRLIA